MTPTGHCLSHADTTDVADWQRCVALGCRRYATFADGTCRTHHHNLGWQPKPAEPVPAEPPVPAIEPPIPAEQPTAAFCAVDGCLKRPRVDRTWCYGHSNPGAEGRGTLDDGGYVKVGTNREHRLVMERHLGRVLRADEEVHHKNGVRTDNRLENLELWSKSHPSGKRAVDVVAWALDILDRYEAELPLLVSQ